MSSLRLSTLCMLWTLGAYAFPANAGEDGCAPVDADAAALTTYVTQQLQARPEMAHLKLELTPMSALPPMKAPDVRMLETSLRSRMPVELHGKACGAQRSSKTIVWFEVHAYRQAWVYGRDGQADDRVSDLIPSLQRVDLASEQINEDDLASEPEDHWLSRPVRAGAVVLKKHLRSEPVVVRNASVTVVVDAPGLKIQKQGRALQSGAIGEQVPVQIAGTSSRTQTIVVGKGEVHVER